MPEYSTDEMMTVAAARRLPDGALCFVGVGLPSAAANLARLTHAPRCKLIYESGPIGAKPTVLPLSIGDGELGETADTIVPLPELFSYWLQAGRIDLGFLGAAQIDRFGNLNTTVIGPYDRPGVRLPGAGGAPEIAASAREVFVVLRQNDRAFVETLDFVTSVGRPTAVITDIGTLTPDHDTKELTLTSLHAGKTAEDARRATGWPLRIAEIVADEPPPTERELSVLRSLQPVRSP